MIAGSNSQLYLWTGSYEPARFASCHFLELAGQPPQTICRFWPVGYRSRKRLVVAFVQMAPSEMRSSWQTRHARKCRFTACFVDSTRLSLRAACSHDPVIRADCEDA